MKTRWLTWCFTFIFALFCTVALPSLARMPQSSLALVVAQSNADALVQQGKALYDAGQFAKAISILQQAAQHYQQQGDDLQQALVLSNLALAYQQSGSTLEANQAIQQSLNLLENLPSTADRLSVQAQTLDVQGRLQFTQGQTESALTTWQRAAEVYRQLEDIAGLTANQIDQSRALRALGFYQRAIELLGQVLQLPQQVPVRPEFQSGSNQTFISLAELLGFQASLIRQEYRVEILNTEVLAALPRDLNTAVALQSLGEVLQASGSLGPAYAVLQQSRKIAELHQASELVAAIQLDLGNLARTQGNQEDALAQYEAAAQQGETTTQIRAGLNELSLYIERAEWDQAQSLIASVYPQLIRLPLSQTALYARINFANSVIKWLANSTVDANFSLTQQTMIQLLTVAHEQARDMGNLRIAAYAMSSLGKLHQVAQQWQEAEWWSQKAVDLAQQVDAADVAYLSLWQLGQILKTQAAETSDIKQSEQYLTTAKTAYQAALDTLKLLRYDLASVSQDEQFNFRDAIEPAYREQAELLLSGSHTPPSPSDLDAARTTLEGLQIAELQNFLRQACDDAFVSIDQIVEAASSEQEDSTQSNASKTAVIYPIILPHQLHVILEFPQENQLYHYSHDVEAQAARQMFDQLYNDLSSRESNKVIQQSARTIYDWLIAPGKLELDRHQPDTLVFVLDSALQRIPMAVLYDGNHYLIETYSIALAQGLKMPKPQPLDRADIRFLVAGLSQEVPGEAFSPLEYVTQETAGIQQEVNRSTLLKDSSFTAAVLQNQIEQSQFQVVHLATHGVFSANQDDTFILAADRRINVVELAQVLRARDQSQPDPLELLVLSACQTAQGDRRAALGLSGVAVRAGARSTIGSLWSVNDQSSADLMVEFYRQWKKHPTYTKAKALQQAQIEIMKRHDSPYSCFEWAPFVLVGSWL